MLLLIPGQIELHLMLSPTKSAAIPLLRPITAALVDPYTHRLGAPVTGIHTFYRKICYIWLPVLEKNLNMSSCLNCGILNAFCCYNGKSKNKSEKYVRERQREREGGLNFDERGHMTDLDKHQLLTMYTRGHRWHVENGSRLLLLHLYTYLVMNNYYTCKIYTIKEDNSCFQ